MAKTIGRHIRIGEDHWRFIEALADARNTSPNRLLVELAVEALDRREWPRTELEVQLLRSAMFASQALAHDMITDGRGEEVEQIRRGIDAHDLRLRGEWTLNPPGSCDGHMADLRSGNRVHGRVEPTYSILPATTWTYHHHCYP